jgi:acyl-CoA thioesterase
VAIDDIKELSSNDRFAALAGVELTDVSPGRATARMEIQGHHLNAADIVHGGAIFTLADFAFAMASNSHGPLAVAINASISFLKTVRGGTLTAEAREVSKNAKLASYTVDITDDAGDLVAVFQGMVYRKPVNRSDRSV